MSVLTSESCQKFKLIHVVDYNITGSPNMTFIKLWQKSALFSIYLTFKNSVTKMSELSTDSHAVIGNVTTELDG